MSVLPSAHESERPQKPIYRWFVLLLLGLISAFSLMDRQLPFVLAEAIKRDLQLTDAQLGIIGGLGFSVFYTLFSLPLARLADTTSRKWVITGVLAFWSVATALGGLAQNFVQMFVSRVGVAAGEAGVMAPAQAMIADYFEPGIRATAMALFLAGSTIGVMLGFGLGGWIGAQFGWREAFFLLGVPGVILALIAAAALRDRPGIDQIGHTRAGIWVGTLRLARIPTYRNLTLGASLHGIGSVSIFAWLASFLSRAHGYSIAEAGLIVGLLSGIAGTLSITLSGVLSDRLAKHDRRWQMWVPMVGVLLGLPLFLAGLSVSSSGLAIVALALACLICTSYAGPIFATVQDLALPAERALSSAIVVLVVGLASGAIGPPLTGLLSDTLAPHMGSDSLGFALGAVLALVHLGAAVSFWLASRTLPGDLAGVERCSKASSADDNDQVNRR